MTSVSYVCPECKGALVDLGSAVRCERCEQEFPRKGSIVDLTTSTTQRRNSGRSLMQKAYAGFFDLIAPVYESWFWYQLTLNLSGAKDSSIQTIADFVSETLSGIDGAILDVACGTATYGRRVGRASRSVYGIDMSMGMLRKGIAFLERERISNVHLARADVMQLPFESAVFDGAICAGSLHLFADALGSLREIARTMKAGAPFAVQTFVPRNDHTEPSLKERTGFHLFDPNELQQCLADAGFGDFKERIVGTVLTVASHKIPTNQINPL